MRRAVIQVFIKNSYSFLPKFTITPYVTNRNS